MSQIILRSAVLALAVAPIAAQACATCGCSLSSDAALGYATSTGWRVSLEYDFIDQNQLRTRYSPIAPAQVAEINDAGGAQEVEHGTNNRYLTAGITYIPSLDWTFTTLVPYVNRNHTTYGNATADQLNTDDISSAHSVGLGDIKLILAYQGLLEMHNLGLQLGVKLPSGRDGGQNVVTGATVGHDPVFFDVGPSRGSALDTSLNPGNGSTDLILGAYYYRPLSTDFLAFVNGQIQGSVTHALNQTNAEFRPGTQENFSLGIRFERNPVLTPQFQVNITHKSPDQGALADNTDTAGTVVYVSPGVTTSILKPVQAFAFVQRPVFSDLNGYQVFPHWTGSVGLSYGF
jgi:hypothetical protein